MKKDNVQEVDTAISCIWNKFLNHLKDHYIDKCMMTTLNIEKEIQEVDHIKNLKKIKKKEAEVIKNKKKKNP